MTAEFPDNARREEGRPDPEELLERYHLRDSDTGTTPSASPDTSRAQRPQRGKLRVYLGAAAGVGKTYAMLAEGNRRKARGTDVVIGFVETHGRAKTQEQIGNLEVIPRKKITYRGVTLEEMDTDAVIARHPKVALIDELAHTNVPGSKHTKRYQDVQDILDAGIDVITTLNVQHLESLNDLITSITGIRVRETLPDYILDQADEVELVDIAPTALRQRMKHGNVYPPERIETALNNFFREGNLTALREIALRLTASKTESQLQKYMTEQHITAPWTATERVLVGFDHRPHSKQVIRDAWRLAHGLHADFIAVNVELAGYAAFVRRLVAFFKYGSKAGQIRAARKEAVEKHARLAEDLGAEVIRVKSGDVACTLADLARQRRVTQIVLGQPMRSRLEEFLYGSLVNRLLRQRLHVDIHLVPVTRESEK
ncbi:MAG: universal stress protein [Ktedonobacteraceae bacterium]|nr:universal stress protein [Ktedonobacteraceae bacterium]